MKQNDCEQISPEWFQARKGCVTGTVLKNIMGTKDARQKAFYKLLGGRLTVGIEDDYENARDRGIRLEPEAIAMFEFETNLKVEATGLCSNDDNEKIAYSPDGLIGEDEDVEIKCMGSQNHTMMWLENEIPKDYKWQVVQAFIVNPKLKKRYFVGYNPDIPIHPLHIIEVKREEILLEIKKAEVEQKAILLEVESTLSMLIKL